MSERFPEIDEKKEWISFDKTSWMLCTVVQNGEEDKQTVEQWLD
jgi:hypothetical protein